MHAQVAQVELSPLLASVEMTLMSNAGGHLATISLA